MFVDISEYLILFLIDSVFIGLFLVPVKPTKVSTKVACWSLVSWKDIDFSSSYQIKVFTRILMLGMRDIFMSKVRSQRVSFTEFKVSLWSNINDLLINIPTSSKLNFDRFQTRVDIEVDETPVL